jgi:transcriptional regulator with XRE-family HTH domain
MRLARQFAGMTQAQAARQLGVTVRTYARWERADTAGFLGQLPRIAEALGTTVADLAPAAGTPQPWSENGNGAADENTLGAILEELRTIRAILQEIRQD